MSKYDLRNKVRQAWKVQCTTTFLPPDSNTESHLNLKSQTPNPNSQKHDKYNAQLQLFIPRFKCQLPKLINLILSPELQT